MDIRYDPKKGIFKQNLVGNPLDTSSSRARGKPKFCKNSQELKSIKFEAQEGGGSCSLYILDGSSVHATHVSI